MVQSYANEEFRIAKETSYGTLGGSPDWIILKDIRLDPQPSFETEEFMASGDTAPSVSVVNDDFTVGSVAGKVGYNSAGYLLQSQFGAPATTTPGGATTAKQHDWEWDGRSPLVPVSYAGSHGIVGAADLIPGLLFNGFGVSGGRGGFDLTSAILGKAMSEGQELGGYVPAAGENPAADNATVVPPVPVFPLHGSIFMDNSMAAVGTTRLLQVYDMGIDIGERVARTRPINALRTSDGIVETSDQEHTVSLQFGVDPVERANFDAIRAGTFKFVRVQFEGNTIEAAIKYLLRFDMCLAFRGVSAKEDSDSVLTRTWDTRIMRDPTSGVAMRIRLINTVTAY